MTQGWNGSGLKKSVLATLIGLAAVQSVHALKPLSDESLSETTGEGIALLPENFKMVFQGPNDLSAGSSYARGVADPSKYDTGLIRIIPVGENYDALKGQTGLGARQTKGDVFIYGLALSRSNNNMNQRYSNEGFDWGSTENPWLFRAGTANVQQFTAPKADLGYLALEAPLAKAGIENGVIVKDDSDNNIKQGFWLDAFSRKWDSSNVVDPITGAPVAVNGVNADLTASQRIRLQYIANGLSLNGTQLRMFQTQASSNAQYNKTLGLAAILRINTNDDPSALVFENTEANRQILDAKGIRIGTAATDDGQYATPALAKGGTAPLFHATEGVYLYSPNVNLVLGNMYQPYIFGSEGNNIALEVTRIPNVEAVYKKIYTFYDDAEIVSGSIVAGKTYYKIVDGKYIDVSVANSNRYNKGADGKYTQSNTGLYVYDATNKSYVQLVASGTTFTSYSSDWLTSLKNSYEGSTCNVSSCGTNGASIVAGGTTTRYQGNNATHSSISVGTVALDPVKNVLKPSTAANATGVVFRGPSGTVNLGSAAIDGVLIQHLKFKTTGL